MQISKLRSSKETTSRSFKAPELQTFKKSNYDCLTNTLKTSYPPGQEFWIYKGDSLTKLNQLVKKSDKLREHVGYNFSRFNFNFHYDFINIMIPVIIFIDISK